MGDTIPMISRVDGMIMDDVTSYTRTRSSNDTMTRYSLFNGDIAWVRTRKFDRGWHGSVDKTFPDNPKLEAVFSGITGEMARVMRGVQ